MKLVLLAVPLVLAGCGGPFPERPPVIVRPTSAASVPPATAAPTCPPAGVRLEMGAGDAASGLRVLGIELVNCGHAEYRLDGYPVVRPLDEHRAVADVQVLDGIAQVTHAIPPLERAPSPVVLAPGQRAEAFVVWRNTYTDTTHPPVTVPLLAVAPRAGAPSEVLTPTGGALDLGSTGRFGVSPWQPSSTPASPSTLPSAPSAGPDV
ncbi:DUF4232 domain-containing protein [Actinoplanes sp. TBRC 11911]|uniref:DUF4232 domain-containing protein n=1 Tax=Actinoplanes sp. TBRC 11911 TaxID=2729386 RepID=UPI00145ED98D|nr:DUF4232 domain-containing protein [Actinoplanes sp. TBRC 11911]NMO49711.1 DUF4232 domain-containing protein [Actinoplanes sp. TBRC 11911]